MATWSSKRQIKFISILMISALIILGVPIYFKFFNKAPTCFDGIKNNNELGIDCGGWCQKVCKEDAKDLNILYARFFATTQGIYSLVANVENPNQGVYATDASYVFRTYDKDNVLLDERKGTTYIATLSTFPVLEYGVFLGGRVPAKTILSFNQPIDWKKGVFIEPKIIVSDIKTDEQDLPQISANLKNNEVYEVDNVRAIVVVYDKDGNTIGTSQTVIDKLSPKGIVPVNFTWNKPFEAKVSRVDIIPRVLPRDIR